VEQGSDTFDHREYEDLIAAAALGALTPEEHERLRRHMRSCAWCREAYSRLLVAADALPLTVEEREPPAALRERLRAQVEAQRPASPPESSFIPITMEQPAPAVMVPRAIRRIPRIWLAAAAAMLVIGLVAGALVGRSLLGDDGEQLATEQIAMQYPTDMKLTDASLTWLPDEQVLRFSAPEMPAPPEGRVYQVWLIAGQDQPPTPVGTVDVSTGQFATSVDRDRFGTFAVTVEPGPLGSPEPTTDPVIVAALR
jgi:hypothetical protein